MRRQYTTIAAMTTLLYVANAAQAQAPLFSNRVPTAQFIRGYNMPTRRAITNGGINQMHPRLQDHERRLNALGFTLANRNDSWKALPVLDQAITSAQIANLSALGNYNYSVLTSATVSDTLSKTWEAGNKSSLWASASFNMTHSGTRTMARLQATGRFDGALFGFTKNLAMATADLQGPSTGNKTASLSLSVLGQTIWSKNSSDATSARVNDGFDWNGRLWQTGFDWSIAGYGVGAEIWLQGSVGAHYSGSAYALNATAGAHAKASIGVGGRAWANLGIVDADLRAELTLAYADIIAIASTTVTSTGTPQTGVQYKMNAHRTVSTDLRFLSGYARVSIKDSLFGFEIANWTLWNNPNGIFNYTGILDNHDRTVAIP